MKDPAHEQRWLDRPRNLDRLTWSLVAICALLVAIELFAHRHAEFDWEGWPGFYAVVGFVAFFTIVMLGKHLRRFLKREEDYYDR